MPVNSRRKGSAFEREIAAQFEAAGFHVRGLESGGDHLCVYHDAAGPGGDSRLVHVECKRQERLKVPEWLEQLERDAPEHVLRVLVFRQSRRPAYAVLPFEQYLRLVGGDS